MQYAIQADGLVKHYGETKALDGVDLAVPTGRLLGVLGPNGAGKTTAVRILATLLTPDAGTATVLGFDVAGRRIRCGQLIGLTGQYAAVDEMLTGVENLMMIGRLLAYPVGRRGRAKALLGRFDLADAADRATKTYSGGMRRRLDLAASLVGRRRCCSWTSRRPVSTRAADRAVGRRRGLMADGVTVLLTTQYLEEADQLADDIVVFDHGKVIASGTSDELKATTGAQVLEVRPLREDQLDLVAKVVTDVLDVAPDRPAPWSRPRCSDPAVVPRSSAASTTSASSPPSWHCASPASTRCSWP